MKIRDIGQYLEGYCPEADRSLLGTDEEPFLEIIYGLGQQLDSTIRDVASFAKDSEEQLFYEFSRTLLTQRRIPFAFILTTTTSSFSIMVSLSILTSTNTKSFPMVSFITF
ncbi:MAG: hypothetical protein IJM41_03915 [Bacteroidales bacterium]|nr:hypothetical protein [Bacteroidales bacterium]